MAKYISRNALDQFHFHDACFSDIEMICENMVWKLVRVNVTKENSQNNLGVDMEAGLLLLEFKDWKITEIEYSGYVRRDEKGNIIDQQPNTFAPEENYLKILLNIGKNNGVILGISCNCNHNNDFRGCSVEFSNPDVLNIELQYSEVKAEWNNYKSKAWYIK